MTNFRTTTSLKASLAGAVVSVCLLASPASAQQQPQPPQNGVQRILVVEMARVTSESKIGKDIRRQMDAFSKQLEADLKGREDALKAEQTKMAQQGAILSKSAKDQKDKEFRAKVTAFQQYANNRQQLIQGGLYKAQNTVQKTLQGVLLAIMKARGGTFLAEKSQFLIVAPNAPDVTGEAVQRLDQALPSLKIEPTPLPPEVLAAAQRQQQLQQQQQQRQ